MNQVQQQHMKRRIKHTVSDFDQLHAQLAAVRKYCAELTLVMRQVREDAIRAQQSTAQQQEYQRRRNNIKLVNSNTR